MAQVNVRQVLTYQTLGPGAEGEWWTGPVSSATVRWFTAVPINPVIDGILDNDQFVQVTEVWHVLKGNIHNQDGTGGTGDVLAFFRVRNRDTVNPATFDVYMAEAS